MTSRDEHAMESNVGGSNTTADRHQLAAAAISSTTASPLAAISTASSKLLLDKQKYIENYDFPYCEESSKYEPLKKIGQGTFGEVFKARERQQSKFVALKKVLMDNEKEGVSQVISSCCF